MNRKRKSDYESLMRDIAQLAWEAAQVQLTPVFITTDYERALRSAVKEVFGTAECYGCITHFLRAINRAYAQKAKRKVDGLMQTDVGSLIVFAEDDVSKCSVTQRANSSC